MKKLLLGLVALFAFAGPALAQECKNTLAGVETMLADQGVAFKRVPAEGLQDFIDKVLVPIVGPIENVTNVLIADFGGQPVAGIEFTDGCLTDPIALAPAVKPTTLI